ncbi:MAG: hypothetical protein U0M06_00405, partial [Clostridia bacterium]|nr:hypothetical protein [Clostridia bacterium]
MKKLLALILAILMLTALASCGVDSDNKNDVTTEADVLNGQENNDPVINNDLTFNITVISGTTGMGFAKLMNDDKLGNAGFDYNFEVVSGADVVAPAIINGSADIAAVPTNLAATLYKKTNGDIRILAANTLGVLYLI